MMTSAGYKWVHDEGRHQFWGGAEGAVGLFLKEAMSVLIKSIMLEEL